MNAGGPWVEDVIRNVARINSSEGVRLVRGSHIVTRKLYDHDRCYFFQGTDGRIIFAIPYEQDFTLIGTTDQDHKGVPGTAVCTEEERDYLLGLRKPVFRQGRDGRGCGLDLFGRAAAVQRRGQVGDGGDADYVLSLDATGGGAPLLNVFGGKITTYRRLAESALAKLAPFFPQARGPWTARVALPAAISRMTGWRRWWRGSRRASPS